MSALREDLSEYSRNTETLSIRQRSRAIWNEIPEKQRLTCRLLELKSQGHIDTTVLSHGQSSTSDQSAKIGRMLALVDMFPSADESLRIAFTL